MPTAHAPVTGSPQLDALLLGYLEAPGACRWPGADGLTTAEAIGEYPAAAAAHQVPGWEELVRSHPELAEEVGRYLASQAARTPCAD